MPSGRTRIQAAFPNPHVSNLGADDVQQSPPAFFANGVQCAIQRTRERCGILDALAIPSISAAKSVPELANRYCTPRRRGSSSSASPAQAAATREESSLAFSLVADLAVN
jgi:hypothetical protein